MLNRSISANTTINFLLEPVGASITVSGRVLDVSGHPLANQSIKTGQQSTTTDLNGYYSFAVAPGDLSFQVTGANNVSGEVPQFYRVVFSLPSVTTNTEFDITLPAKKVEFHVQDAEGNPVNGVMIRSNDLRSGNYSSYSNGNLPLGGNIIGQGGSGAMNGVVTDQNGDAVLWLFVNDYMGTASYFRFDVIPPSGYRDFTITNLQITGDVNEVISLQYSYNPPFTAINLEALNDDGTYSKPTTVTLSATAAEGYTVSNTYYKIDDGSQRVYSGSFEISEVGEHVIEYWSVDNSGVVETHKTKQFTIYQNQAPSIDPFAGAYMNEGDVFTVSSFFTDPDSDSWSATVDYDEGAGPEPLILNPDKTFILSHQYNAPGTYTVTVVVEDDGFATGATISTVTVNASPQVMGLSDAEINFQDEYFATGSFTDSDSTSWTGTVDYGDGFGVQDLTLTNYAFVLDHHYPAVGNYSVTINITDNQGATGTATFNVKVNAPPYIFQLPAATINEGQAYTENGSFADIDSNSWSATVSYGDGSGSQPLVLNTDKTFALDHLYKDNGEYTVTVSITDNQGAVGTEEVKITVDNVNPKIDTIAVSSSPIKINESIQVRGEFSDPGVLDTHTANWTWGDGSTSQGDIIEVNGSGNITGNHSYDTAGVYEVKLTVTDKDGGSTDKSYQYVVVYDPEGGFVTGGGTILSPAGAYISDPAISGRANFGFVSKYQKGANKPSGNTEFNFQTAKFNFKSTSYDWLVVAGAKAQYKGVGEINGEGVYEFMLTAIDGQSNGGGGTDRFRVKITDKTSGILVYDNQLNTEDSANPATAVQGSIVIHK